MSSSPAISSGAARAASRREAGTASASVIFVAAMLFFWVSITPFVDRSDPAMLVPTEGANVVNQIAIVALTALVLWRASKADVSVLRVLFTWSGALMLAWFGVSALMSGDPSSSIRRFVQTLMVFALAAGMLTLPRDVRDFARLMAIVCGIVLVVSYLGLVLVPDLAIHHADDIAEPEHDGDWRGLFNHKNAAGGAMALSIIFGLFVSDRYNRAVGWAIVVASAVFLVFTHAKTATQIILPVLLLAWMVTRTRSRLWRAVLVWGGLAAASTLTVGSILFAPVKALVAATMSDPTFTSRTFIWQYVLDRFGEHPLFGHGYGAFWGSTGVFFGEAQKGGGNTASHAHNIYLDLLIQTGVPGLLLGIVFFVIRPLVDANRAFDANADRATTVLFLRLYIFGIFFGTLEGYLLMNGGAVWISVLLAVLGLRLNANASLRAGAASPVPMPRRRAPVVARGAVSGS